jgi:hypothetical protein
MRTSLSDGGERGCQAVPSDGEEGGGHDAERTHPGDFGFGRVGEDADGGATHTIGLGEMHDLADSGLTGGESTPIEVEGELLQVERNGAHEVQGRDPKGSRKAIVVDRVERRC